MALARPVTQSAMAAGEAPREGQLRVRHGLLGRRTAALSSGMTAADWREPRRPGEAEPPAGHAGHPAGAAGGLAGAAGGLAGAAGGLAGAAAAADLGRAMTLLTAVRYGRGDATAGPDVEPDALTRAVDAGIGHVARLRWRALAPVRHAEGWAAGARRAWIGLTREAPWRR